MSGQGRQQLGRLDPKSMCECDDIQERDIALSSFDAANVIAVKVREFRQLLLRETPLEAQFADVFSEYGSGVTGRHEAIIVSMTTMSLHTMSVIPWSNAQQTADKRVKVEGAVVQGHAN